MPPAAVLRPALRDALARFVEEAFAVLQRDVEVGNEVPFVIAERGASGAPRLYDYRPLYGPYAEERLPDLRALPGYRAALEVLQADEGARSYACTHAGEGIPADEALRRFVLWPLLVGVAEREEGWRFAEDSFDRVYGTVERHVVATRHRFEAFAPLTGVLLSSPPAELGSDLVLRRAETAEVSRDWPESDGLLPERFGVEPDRRVAIELQVGLDRSAGEAPPDAPAFIAAAVTALRLVSGGPVSAGALVFERLDGTPRGVRPLPTRAAAPLRGEPVRLDAHMLTVAGSLVARLLAWPPPALRLALSRWEEQLTHDEPDARAALAPAVVAPLLSPDGNELQAAALRAAALCGRTAGERDRVARSLRAAAALARGAAIGAHDAGRLAADLDVVVRTVLMAAILDERGGSELADELDGVLLGARPRPLLVPDGLVVLAA